jgi:EAL domain-containing protein (putative c-di-GMP-specific phosphodiesterase class I)/GGDEF domain-containing protein
MQTQRLVTALRGVRRFGVHGGAILFAALGMATPLGVLLWTLVGKPPHGGVAPSIVIACAAASALCMLLVGLTLQSVGRAATALRALVQMAGPSEKFPSTDESTDMLGDVLRLEARMESVRSRLTNRHPRTGLPTREPFLSGMAADMLGSTDARLAAVIRFCDYDRLASFDQLTADRALTGLSARLQGAIEKGCGLAQVDRDCFALWFGGVSLRDATRELRALSFLLSQDLGSGEHRITPELKIGAAIYPHDASEATSLLTRAFSAIPKAGDGQEDNLTFFSATSTVAARERFSMEQDLRSAISRDQLKLYFQPIVDLSQGRVVGAEALLRWFHPELGAVPPSDFIPVLEKSGLNDEVGLWAMDTACRAARVWRERGLEDLKVAINLSARQFRDPVLSMAILKTLERHRLLAQDLELELPEAAVMQDVARTRELLLHFNNLGVDVAIDNFGTGSSSLSRMKTLRFTRLKIDREFVTEVHKRPDSRAICATLIALAQGLDMTVLADGVEDADELNALLDLGCSLFQGFHFSPALPTTAFIETISDPNWLARLGLVSPGVAAPELRRA